MFTSGPPALAYARPRRTLATRKAERPQSFNGLLPGEGAILRYSIPLQLRSALQISPLRNFEALIPDFSWKLPRKSDVLEHYPWVLNLVGLIRN